MPTPYAAADAASPRSTSIECGQRQPGWPGAGPQAPCHSRWPCCHASTIARHCLRCSEDFRRRTEPEFLFAMSVSPSYCDAALIVHRSRAMKPLTEAPPSFRQGQYACGGLANDDEAFRGARRIDGLPRALVPSVRPLFQSRPVAMRQATYPSVPRLRHRLSQRADGAWRGAGPLTDASPPAERRQNENAQNPPGRKKPGRSTA